MTPADISTRLPAVAMTKSERGKAGNAALTKQQRSDAGKARAAMLHDIETLARRIAAKWPEASDEKRRAVRRILREGEVTR